MTLITSPLNRSTTSPPSLPALLHIAANLTDDPVGHPDGMVEVPGEVRDVYSGRDVYCILDEGCNSSCHSSKWAEDATRKFNALGYDFPFKTPESKSFAGLGSKGSKTEGLRTVQFSLRFADSDRVLNGVVESQQLAEGDTPMLLPLHAQAALGIMKNMRTCEISIHGKPLEWFRCSRTGLLMLNFTQGLRNATEESMDDPVPKCHRKYRAFTGFTSDSRTMAGGIGLT